MKPGKIGRKHDKHGGRSRWALHGGRVWIPGRNPLRGGSRQEIASGLRHGIGRRRCDSRSGWAGHTRLKEQFAGPSAGNPQVGCNPAISGRGERYGDGPRSPRGKDHPGWANQERIVRSESSRPGKFTGVNNLYSGVRRRVFGGQFAELDGLWLELQECRCMKDRPDGHLCVLQVRCNGKAPGQAAAGNGRGKGQDGGGVGARWNVQEVGCDLKGRGRLQSHKNRDGSEI